MTPQKLFLIVVVLSSLLFVTFAASLIEEEDLTGRDNISENNIISNTIHTVCETMHMILLLR